MLVQLKKEYKRHWEKELDASKFFFFLNRYGERYSEQSARRMIQFPPPPPKLTYVLFRKMLGHASIMTTQIYAEVALEKADGDFRK